ncbi:SNF2-related protein [Rhabdochromatium marinum]|uniref:SNF2-related protein n=1 Tax=Rhabdochromatium marinum TaxID=48729 RepID=UPI0019063D1E|nr:helicase SNF2 [Rhabdochromatium marinum]
MISNDLIRTFQNEFDLQSFERGARYFRNSRVQTLNIDHERNIISGRVRGSGQQLYSTTISIDTTAEGAPSMLGRCSCPVSLNCKHMVALLFAAQARLSETSGHGAAAHPAEMASLPPELIGWLSIAERVQQQLSNTDPYCLLFHLELGRPYHRLALFLRTYKTRRTVDGGFGKREPFHLLGRSRARFITNIDQRIMAMAESVARNPGASTHDQLNITGPGSADLLQLLVSSGRAYWQPGDHQLHWQGQITAQLRWALQENATLTVTLDGGPPGALVLPCEPPGWLDPATGDCGLLDTDLDPATATLLAEAPAVPASAIEGLRQRFDQRLTKLQLPMPPMVERQHVTDLRPVPRLELWSEHRQIARELRHWGMPDQPSWVDGATFSFRYGQQLVAPDAPQTLVEDVREGMVMESPRHRELEQQASQTLRALGFDFEYGTHGQLHLTDADKDWLQVVVYDLPKLRHQGWEIVINPSFRYQLADIDDWEFQLEDNAQDAWFSLALGVEVDGQRIDLLPLLVDLMHRYRDELTPQALAETPDDTEFTIRLPDGRYALMPLQRIRPLLTTLIELYDDKPLDKDGRLRLAPSQRGQLAELEQALPQDTRWSGAEQALAWGRRLRDFDGIAPVEPPVGLNAELRPYQRKGLDWLQFLRDFDLGGVLADDMGLGKTIQCLTHLLVEKQAGRADHPSLVVAPTSLMFNWRREAERFTPELKVLLLQGPARRTRFAEIPQHDLVLTTYPLLPRDYRELSAYTYHLLILDEAQAVKNPRSKAAEAVRAVKARHRLCLTGTPLENHLGELWSLMDFLMPGLLGDDRRFKRLFRTPIEKFADQPRSEQLRRRIAPFMLRRTKEEVAPELPPKTEILREVPITGTQRDLYETLRLAMHERVRKEVERKGLSRSGIVILDALLKLRQVCCDPRLVPLDSARQVKESAKLDLLMELLTDLLDEGRHILLFSQFASMLDLIEGELKTKRKLRPDQDYVKLTGRTRNRDVLVDRFQSGEVPLFLISLKAGGSGLNLTAADTVIHYDPWWNPAAERQATDRAHRIGQDKPVFVYKLLTEGTVEQKVAELQARKQALADAMLSGGSGAAASLSANDLEMLFSPIAEAE